MSEKFNKSALIFYISLGENELYEIGDLSFDNIKIAKTRRDDDFNEILLKEHLQDKLILINFDKFIGNIWNPEKKLKLFSLP